MTEHTSIVRYDDVLPEVVRLTINEFGVDFFNTNLLLRDADGVVTIILRQEADADQCSRLSKALQDRLGSYAANSPIAKPDDLFDPSLNDAEGDKWELVQLDDNNHIHIRYLERRIVGNDWVRGIQSPILNTPQIVVFSSLKGGVGRSTALSIAAMDLCKRGKSVLAIDLDLEAPGIGGMFLSEATLPKYGALDFYVEYGRTELTQEFLQGMCGVTTFNESGGKLTIVPAAGQSSQNSPQNVLGKISRAYLEMVNQDGAPDSFLDKTRALISSLCNMQKFDVVFIDARAGLNETTAATIQGLGADVLFFGVDTPQTWEGYKYFFSHLARYKMQAKIDYDWRFKIKVVHAKALDDHEALMRFRDESFELFASYLYDELEGDEAAEGLPDAFSFDLDDPTAPHFAWPIYMSSDFYEFKPLEMHEQTDQQIIEPIFGVFLSNLNDRLNIE
jgi:hypothetical protein